MLSWRGKGTDRQTERWEHMGWKGFPEAMVSIRLTCPLCFTIAPLGSQPPSPHKTHHRVLPFLGSLQRCWRMLVWTQGWGLLPKAKPYLLLNLHHVWESREQKLYLFIKIFSSEWLKKSSVLCLIRFLTDAGKYWKSISVISVFPAW